MVANSPMIQSLSLDYEAAYEAVAELKQPVRDDLNGVTVYSGVHPEHGPIHIVIPAMGSSLLLLPFALHEF